MNGPIPEPPDTDEAPTVEVGRDRERETLEAGLLVELLQAADQRTPLATVQPEDFTDGLNRRLWETMRLVHGDGQQVRTDTVIDRLEADGHLPSLGGWWPAYERLSNDRTYAGSAMWHAERLAERGRRERLAQAGRRLAAMAAGGEVDLEAVEAELKPLAPMPQRGITGPWDVRDKLLARLEDPTKLEGLRTGWTNVDTLYRIEPGLLSVVTGIPGSGKSTWLDNVLVRMVERHDWRIAVFSPESAPTERHVGRIAGIKLAAHPARITVADLDSTLDWIEDRFRWIESTDGLSLADVLHRADAIRNILGGLDGLVVDPWNELVHDRADSTTETQHISEGLTNLRRWGRRHKVHIWLVAHPKKLEKRGTGEYPPPTLYDISGSSTWHDKADMGVVVHRDKRTPGPVDVHIVKVRFDDHGDIGTAKLFFDKPTATYRDAAPEWRTPA